MATTQNNDGERYVITMDTAKEGAELWSLNDYFKARVGDNRTPLYFRWYTMGLLNQFTGTQKPCIRGKVGNFTIDDTKRGVDQIEMAPDAVSVSWTGSTSDMMAGGLARYELPEQLFPKSGIFKGFIGYVDDSAGEQRLSGVNVWFKVLDGFGDLGKDTGPYIAELEKILANADEVMRQKGVDFDTKTNQALADLQAKYQQEVAANQAAATSTRADLSHLTNTVKDIQSQIDAGAIVTRATFDKKSAELSDAIDDRLAQIHTDIQTYASADEIKAKFPSGAEGPFLAMDTGHQWYYRDGSWQDAGAYQSAGLSKEILDELDSAVKVGSKAIDSSNYVELLPNADEAKANTIFELDFSKGDKTIPTNLPFEAFPTSKAMLFTSSLKTQLLIADERIFERLYDGGDHHYMDWVEISSPLASNLTITDTKKYATAGDLPVNKVFSVADNVYTDLPVTGTASVVTLGSRTYSRDGLMQLCTTKNGRFFMRATQADRTWTSWKELTSREITDSLHTDFMRRSNKIWQKRDGVNVIRDHWLNSVDKVEKYAGWCYTPDFLPVKPGTDYVFAKRDTNEHYYQVMPIDSVFVNKYDASKKLIATYTTSGKAGGNFNTGNAYYIRFSMSYQAHQDYACPSLYEGASLPAIIEKALYSETPQSDSEVIAEGLANFDLMPGVDLPKVDGLPMYLYSDNLLYGNSTDSYVYLYDNYSNAIKSDQELDRWSLPKDRLSSGLLTFYATKGEKSDSYWLYPDNAVKRESNFHVKGLAQTDAAGKKLKVLVIGDSLTNFNKYIDRAGELAKADPYTKIDFIGTRGDVTKHEGRGGWSAKIYTTNANFNTYSNPFLNGTTFDFSNYMSANGFDGVDLVIINLGTNDVTYNDITRDPNFDQDFKAYQTMIDSIKAYNPKVKIALGTPIPPARYKGANDYVKSRRQKWIFKLLDYCHTNGFYFIPYWYVVDPINDFKYKEAQIDEYNATTITRIDDSTHPADSGYMKMGDLTYATIKMIAAGMQNTMQ